MLKQIILLVTIILVLGVPIVWYKQKEKNKPSIWAHIEPEPFEDDFIEPQIKENSTPLLGTDPFDGFIGNSHAITTIRPLIQYTKNKNSLDLFPNIAFYGPRSSGKSELSKRTASALGLTMLSLTEENLKKEKVLIEKLKPFWGPNGLSPLVVFVDEVHSLSSALQDKLLLATEPSSKTLKTQNYNIDCKNVIFIIATTDPSKLTNAFRSRFLTINLKPYNEDEIIEILKKRIDRDDRIDHIAHNILPSGMRLIAKAGRYIPRESIQILSTTSQALKSFEGFYDVDWDNEVQNFLEASLRIDHDGLTDLDVQYILTLSRMGQAGLKTIADSLGETPDNIETIVEPFLLQTGLLVRGARGRTLTEAGEYKAQEYENRRSRFYN